MQKRTEGFREKIKTPAELGRIAGELRSRGKKIVHCHGAFDLLHRGHLHQFEQANTQGDVLIVSITTDKFVAKGPGRPVFNHNVRAEMVAALEVVDYVVFSDTPSSVDLIKLLKPDVYVKGQSYNDTEQDLSGRIVLEQIAVESVGGRLFFSQEMPIHSTPLLNNFIDPYPEAVLEYLRKIKKRYSFNNLVEMMDKLQSLKVLVIGEAIIDQYDYVEAMDVSPKGGVIAMRHIDTELFAGGSLACANHISNFCSDVSIVSYLGSQDSHEKMIRNSLAKNIKPQFLIREGLRTIVKKRQVDQSFYRKHSETYLFDDKLLNVDEENWLLGYLDSQLDKFDLILVIDYGHGLITERVVECLVAYSDRLAVNTQTNSANKGFNLISKYPKMNYACLDHFEVKLAMHDRLSNPEALALRLLNESGSSAVAVTLGHFGSIVMNGQKLYKTPVFSKSIVDTVGAGDAFFSLTAPCLFSGMPLDMVGFVGNISGALATTYLGNKISIDKTALFNFAKSLMG